MDKDGQKECEVLGDCIYFRKPVLLARLIEIAEKEFKMTNEEIMSRLVIWGPIGEDATGEFGINLS